MSISYGFFNSVNGDRVYNASSFNDFFAGLISPNGIFTNYLKALEPSLKSGLSINIASGKALVDGCWFINDSVYEITLDPPDTLLPRKDSIVLRKDYANRKISFEVVKGTPSTNPVAHTPTRNESYYELVLAQIKVLPNDSILHRSDMYDCRYDSKLCGIITVLVEQPNVDYVKGMYEEAYNNLLEEMKVWQNSQQAQYTSWFGKLTDTLNVDTRIERYTATVLTSGDLSIAIPESLNHVEGDILEVFVHGVRFVEGLDYEKSATMITPKTVLRGEQEVTFYNWKSVVGYTANQGIPAAESASF